MIEMYERQEKYEMSERLYVRVTVGEDGKTAKRELILDGVKIADVSYLDVISFIMQATSSLRWEAAKR